MKIARRLGLFVLAAAASAVIGAIVLKSPDWIQTHREEKQLKRMLANMRTLDTFVDGQHQQLAHAYQDQSLLPSVSREQPDLSAAERTAALAEHFLVEARIKGSWFSIFPACDEMRRIRASVMDYGGALSADVVGEYAEDITYIYHWSDCRKIDEPRYTYIEGSENEWREHVADDEETENLPESVRDQILSFRGRCTISRDQYIEKPCSELAD